MSSSSEGSLDYDCYRIEPFLIARNAIFSDYPQTDSPIGTRDSFIRGKTPVLMTGLIWSHQLYHTNCASVVPEHLLNPFTLAMRISPFYATSPLDMRPSHNTMLQYVNLFNKSSLRILVNTFVKRSEMLVLVSSFAIRHAPLATASLLI